MKTLRPLFAKLSFLCLITFMMALLSGCPEEETTGPNNTDGDFTLGEKKEYTVSGNSKVEFDDKISGCTFVFPTGGNGKLNVAEIKSGPENALGGVNFYVE